MTTDGGGWTLVMNYVHRWGTNPDLAVLVDALPLQGGSALGDDESFTLFWGHASNALLAELAPTELRFHGRTSAHGRTIHFKTPHQGCVDYLTSGLGSCNGIQGVHELLAGHNANLPAAASSFFSSQGDLAVAEHPFYTTGTYHWNLRGQGYRWEVDDYVNGFSQDTIHRIWIR